MSLRGRYSSVITTLDFQDHMVAFEEGVDPLLLFDIKSRLPASIGIRVFLVKSQAELDHAGGNFRAENRGDFAVVKLSPRNLGSYCKQVKAFAALPDFVSKY